MTTDHYLSLCKIYHDFTLVLEQIRGEQNAKLKEGPMGYTVWMKDYVGMVSPAPDFQGTQEEAEAMLRSLEQSNAHLSGKMVVGPR